MVEKETNGETKGSEMKVQYPEITINLLLYVCSHEFLYMSVYCFIKAALYSKRKKEKPTPWSSVFFFF